VSWQSKLQKCVTLSTTEAEYIGAIEACTKILSEDFFIRIGILVKKLRVTM